MEIKKPKILLAIGAVALFSLMITIVLAGSISYDKTSSISSNKTNIILVMTDDLSQNEFNFLLDNNLMPNLASNMIDKGTFFSNSFVSAPVCCPSRATSLTGQYPHNHNVWLNEPMYDNGKLVANGGFKSFDDSSTLATWLNQGGYKTGYVGKYLEGYGDKTSKFYIPPGWDDWQALTFDPNSMSIYRINDNGKEVKQIDDYQTDHLADRAIQFIEESNSPFFLYISTLAPHSSTDSYTCEAKDEMILKSILVSPKYSGTLDSILIPKSPSYNEEDVYDKPDFIKEQKLIMNHECIDSVIRDRMESLRSVDDLIGDLFLVLKDKNIVDNTLVIFTSDNGFLFGEHRIKGKVSPYDESIRVPLVIKFPGIEKQQLDHLVLNNDLAPTIAELAGVHPQKPIDGFSLMPIVIDPSKKLRDGFLVESWFLNFSYHVIRTQNFSYVTYSHVTYLDGLNFTEFYDMTKDPYQLNNLVSCTDQKCIQILADLSSFLNELKNCENGSCQKIEKG